MNDWQEIKGSKPYRFDLHVDSGQPKDNRAKRQELFISSLRSISCPSVTVICFQILTSTGSFKRLLILSSRLPSICEMILKCKWFIHDCGALI